jgi:hypothetical protein
MDALTYVPATSTASTVSAILPSGTAEAQHHATCAVPAGDTVLFLNAIADDSGGVFLLGETCGAVDMSNETLPCTAFAAQLSASGVLTQ